MTKVAQIITHKVVYQQLSITAIGEALQTSANFLQSKLGAIYLCKRSGVQYWCKSVSTESSFTRSN
jgi:hypothetical protein